MIAYPKKKKSFYLKRENRYFEKFELVQQIDLWL
jgi:hypothetical protein